MGDTGSTGSDKMAADLNRAEKLLEKNRFDETIEICEPYVGRSHLANYYTATAFFKKYPTGEKIDEVITLYRTAIDMDPEFPDTYLMLGYAYGIKASLIIKEYRGHRSSEVKEMALDTLQKAKQNLEKAKEIEPGFKQAAEDFLKLVEKRICEGSEDET